MYLFFYHVIALYNTIFEVSPQSINNLDKADKSLKGLIDGDPWIKAKDVVLELST